MVTGITGFIGSNLAERLIKEGYSVSGIDNLSWGVPEQIPSGAEFHEVDIRSKDSYPLFKDKGGFSKIIARTFRANGRSNLPPRRSFFKATVRLSNLSISLLLKSNTEM